MYFSCTLKKHKYISSYLAFHFQCQQLLSSTSPYGGWLLLPSLPALVLGWLVTEDMWQTRSAFRGYWLELELLTFFSSRRAPQGGSYQRGALFTLPSPFTRGASSVLLLRRGSLSSSKLRSGQCDLQQCKWWHIHIETCRVQNAACQSILKKRTKVRNADILQSVCPSVVNPSITLRTLQMLRVT